MTWNHNENCPRCDNCGRYILLDDIASGAAIHRCVYPDSDQTREEYESLCRRCYEPMDFVLETPEQVQIQRDNARSSLAACRERCAALERLVREVVRATYSHVDGHNLLAELHPRHMLGIIRRVDGQEARFEGDWLSVLWSKVKELEAALAAGEDK